MKPAAATAPLHITGFFEPVFHRDWRRTGSRGAGLALLPGVETTVRPAQHTRILLDGKPSRAPTTRRVVELLAPSRPPTPAFRNETGAGRGPRPVEVRSRHPAPVGAGLGTSGAGALSTAFALDRALRLGHPPAALVAAAHRAEVEMRTGLGTVAGIAAGGLALRVEPGLAPGAVRPHPVRARIAWVSLGRLPTPSILSDPAWTRALQREGRRALRGLLRRPTLECFFELSRNFALDTGLAEGRLLDGLEAVGAAGGSGSVAMLGRTLFALSTPAVRRALAEFGEVRESRVAPAQNSRRPLGKQRA